MQTTHNMQTTRTQNFNDWQDFIKKFQQEDIQNKEQLIQFLLSSVIPFITRSILQMQMQVYSKKDQLQIELPFYKDYVLKESVVKDSMYQKILNKLSWFSQLIGSKFTQNIALSYVLAILESIHQFQINMVQFYQPYIENGLYQKITTKNIEQYLPASIIELINKDCLIDDINISKMLPLNVSQNKSQKRVNLKMIGLPYQFQHRVKITEITELQMVYTNFYKQVYQRQWIKEHIIDPESFWTKPTIISIIYFYIYNQEINKNYYLCLSNILCSDELLYLINKMIKILKM